MPTGLIDQDYGVRIGRHLSRNLNEMEAHGLSIAKREDQPSGLIVLRTDRAKDVCRFRPLVVWS
jgi:hypothetical protein